MHKHNFETQNGLPMLLKLKSTQKNFDMQKLNYLVL